MIHIPEPPQETEWRPLQSREGSKKTKLHVEYFFVQDVYLASPLQEDLPYDDEGVEPSVIWQRKGQIHG
jgi:hypothetical protein